MTTCIQTNHLSGGSFREIKAESTSPPVTPTSTTPSYPIPNTTYSVTIPFPVPTPTFDIPISISTPTSTSSGCSLDFADELPKDSMMRPVAIMTRRARTPSGDSGHPDSPRHEELLKPQDGQTFLAIGEPLANKTTTGLKSLETTTTRPHTHTDTHTHITHTHTHTQMNEVNKEQYPWRYLKSLIVKEQSLFPDSTPRYNLKLSVFVKGHTLCLRKVHPEMNFN